MISKVNNFILVIDFVVIRIPIEHLVTAPLISFIEKAVFNVPHICVSSLSAGGATNFN
jgi:hypothetical protein